MTASLRTPPRRMGIGIGDGRSRRWIAFLQFPRRRPDRRRHSGATTVTSHPRARTWSSIRAAFATRPSDVALAPWTKNRTPRGVGDGSAGIVPARLGREVRGVVDGFAMARP